MTVLTGIVYPLLVTGVSQSLFNNQANGSLLFNAGQVIGSHLLAQKFESSKYFWPRPSAVDYNPLPSGGSNLGPASRDLLSQVQSRKEKLGSNEKIPADLLFASASGLDPDLSPAGVEFQMSRIAKARGLTDSQTVELNALIDQMTEDRTFGILGEPRINVLQLNIEMDRLFSQ